MLERLQNPPAIVQISMVDGGLMEPAGAIERRVVGMLLQQFAYGAVDTRYDEIGREICKWAQGEEALGQTWMWDRQTFVFVNDVVEREDIDVDFTRAKPFARNATELDFEPLREGEEVRQSAGPAPLEGEVEERGLIEHVLRARFVEGRDANVVQVATQFRDGAPERTFSCAEIATEAEIDLHY